MSNEDDYITINITCDQSAALIFVLVRAHSIGILNELPPELDAAFNSFLRTMITEIDRQKL
jgi:hypothetical protein